MTHVFDDHRDSPYFIDVRIYGTKGSSPLYGQDTIKITVVDTALMPVDAGENQTVAVDRNVRFRAFFEPPEGIDQFIYTWDFGDGSSPISVDRYIYQVDEDPEVLTGAIAAACTPGEYTLEVSVSSPDNHWPTPVPTFLVEPTSSMVLSGERLPDGDAVYAEGEVFPIGMIVDPKPTKAEWSGCGLRAVGGTAVMGVDYLEVPAWPVLDPSNDWGNLHLRLGAERRGGGGGG